jgi:hypothetical protein
MELVGTIQFFDSNGKRSNPIALFLDNAQGEYRISWRLPQWRPVIGAGATPNKAAGDFEAKLKAAFPEPGAYDGPSWNGIKAEKPVPPKPAPAPAAETALASTPQDPTPASSSADPADASSSGAVPPPTVQ